MVAIAHSNSSSHAAVINLDQLLAAIAAESPAGENLQYSGLFDKIEQARKEEEDLSQGEWKREAKRADWEQVLLLCTEALLNSTKDLRIAVWMCEALVKIHGFIGLRDGLRLVRELQQRFWEKLYPESDNGDLEARVNALAYLDKQLAVHIRDLPLLDGLSGVKYSFQQFEQSREFNIPENLEGLPAGELEKVKKLREAAAKQQKITNEQWRIAKHSTGYAYIHQLTLSLYECQREMEALDRFNDENYGLQTPALRSLERTLNPIVELIAKICDEKRPAEAGEDALPLPVSADDQHMAINDQEIKAPEDIVEPTAENGVRKISNRREALTMLKELADYFRATEPHSPVSYLVQKAVVWGDMPLEAWLAEVIRDDSVLKQLNELLGIKR